MTTQSTETATPVIEAKNVKQLAMGPDGVPYSATIYVDGVRALSVADAAYGGPLEIQPVNAAGRAALERLERYAASLPQEPYGYGLPGMRSIDVETLVARAVDAALFKAEIARHARKGRTCYQTPGIDAGAYFWIPTPYSALVRREILRKEPGAIILNETVLGVTAV